MDNTFDKMFYMEGEFLAGVDESGTSDIAGPLVAACVILPRIDPRVHELKIFEVNDCKKVPKQFRKGLAEVIWQTAIAIGIGEVQPSELDFFTRQQAASLAMLRAVTACRHTVKGRHILPDFILVDGDHPIPINIKQATIRYLDEKSLCCAAASIIAKVYRDEIMLRLHEAYPHYGWDSNKGFSSDEHLAGLDKHGPVLGVHRMSYWPFRVNRKHKVENEKDHVKWEQRRRGWRAAATRKQMQEIAETLWTPKPPLWSPSRGFSNLHPQIAKPTENTKNLKNESGSKKTQESSL